MPLAPDAPFPKQAGNPIRSKDWNDLVTEVQRLDNAKLNRAGGAMTGALTIAAALNTPALGVGTASPEARLHVVDSVSPTALRIHSTAAFGAARLEMWSDPQGANQWRPGYIESLDLGNWTGGLKFMTNGETQANRTGSVEAMRVTRGRVAMGGVADPGFRLDVGDRIRLRQGANGTAGMWLFQTTPANDRAFIGMNNDDVVGLWGNAGAQWSLNMNVATGNVGIRSAPSADYSLYVAGNARVTGRLQDSKSPSTAVQNNQVSISSINNNTTWLLVPNMSMSVNAPTGGSWFIIRFTMNGVQTSGIPQGQGAHAEFRLLVDGGQQDYCMHEYHNQGWELRGVTLERMVFLTAGSHTIQVQWSVKSPNARPQQVVGPVTIPEVRVNLTGCWYNDNRALTAFEL
ncbi:MAG TPA: hypothetical protein VF142_02660 [Longimicrobium sp.]